MWHRGSFLDLVWSSLDWFIVWLIDSCSVLIEPHQPTQQTHSTRCFNVFISMATTTTLTVATWVKKGDLRLKAPGWRSTNSTTIMSPVCLRSYDAQQSGSTSSFIPTQPSWPGRAHACRSSPWFSKAFYWASGGRAGRLLVTTGLNLQRLPVLVSVSDSACSSFSFCSKGLYPSFPPETEGEERPG